MDPSVVQNRHLKSKNSRHHWRNAIMIYLLFYAMICVFSASFTNFHVDLNDFWGNHYQLQHLNFNRSETLYSGFFPIGYILFLKIFSFGYPIILAQLINIGFGVVILSVVAYLSVSTLGPKWAFFTTLFVSILPKFFKYVTLPGPDIGLTAFVSIGALFLIKATVLKSQRIKTSALIILGGIFCGLGALWRYHGLILACAFLFTTAIYSEKRLKHLLLGLVSLSFVYSPQIIVNLLSGHGLFETSTPFNLYITIHGVDWFKVSNIVSKVEPNSVSIIFGSFQKFLRAYAEVSMSLMPLGLPSLLCGVLMKEKNIAQINMIIGVSSLVYILIVSIGAGASARAALPLLPLCIYSVVCLTKRLYEICRLNFEYESERLISSVALLFILCLFICYCVGYDILKIRNKKMTNAVYQSVEEILVKQEGISHAKQVFVSDFDFYLPNVKPHRPYRNGGWGRYDLVSYNDDYPELRVDSLEDFLVDCHRRNITHLVLTAQAGRLSSEVAKIYTGELGTGRILPIGQIGDFKIFRIDKSSYPD